VNIKLDQHRNQLITTDLILTALTCAMAIITTISGIFGMNLDSGLQITPDVFNEVTIATCLGGLILFVGFIIFAWRRGLLSWS
jgi:magnesium transporter